MPLELFSDANSEAIAEMGQATGLMRFGASYRHPVTVKIPLGHADTGGGVVSWANPEAGSILITRVVLDVTTIATSACALDGGTEATDATTLSDNMLDGIDVHSAAGIFSQADGDATNAKAQQKLAAGKWFTLSKASGAAAGLVGSLYLTYVPA